MLISLTWIWYSFLIRRKKSLVVTQHTGMCAKYYGYIVEGVTNSSRKTRGSLTEKVIYELFCRWVWVFQTSLTNLKDKQWTRGKILAIYITTKGLWYSFILIRETNKSNINTRLFTEERQTASKHVKRCSTSIMLYEMKLDNDKK